MPSAFAHALVGASLASLLPSARSRTLCGLALGAAAAAPDLDVVSFQFDIPYVHPLSHRGLTHSLPFAAACGALSLAVWRKLYPGRWVALAIAAAVTFAAIGSHGVLDCFTDGGAGVGLFIPFENGRYRAPVRPILVSPIPATLFFSREGIDILANEAVWIGIPVLVFLGAVRVSRRIASW